MNTLNTLIAKPLSKNAFVSFGEVIEIDKARQIKINDGFTTRFHDLFHIDVAGHEARAVVSLFRTTPLPLPHRVRKLERHPLGSQAFMPMDDNPFLVLVAEHDAEIATADTRTLPAKALQLFITNGRQGINLSRNTWHHFHIALHRPSDFMVVDRDGDGCNLEEVAVQGEAWVGEVC